MSGVELGFLMFGAMLVLLAIRVPIGVAMFLTGAAGYVMLAGWFPFANYLKTAAFSRFSVYDLSVIPMFLLMGQLASRGGLSAWKLSKARGAALEPRAKIFPIRASCHPCRGSHRAVSIRSVKAVRQ